MFNQSKNPRVFRSLDKIATALFALIMEKDYEAITICEICDKAEVTRKTFYRNFGSKDDVVEFAVYARLQGFFNYPSNLPFVNMLTSVFTFLAQRKPILIRFTKLGIYHLLSSPALKYFAASPRIKNFILKEPHSEVYRKFIANALCGMESSIVASWAEGGCVESPEELTRLSIEIMKSFRFLIPGI